ncbi:MAG: Pycsar system effector family protein [Acidobacteriaceae bacterium]
MDDSERYLVDINNDNLTRVIGFAGAYDTKANFALTIILALTAYFTAELPSYIDAHAKHPAHTWFALLDLAAIGCLGFFLWAVVLIVMTIRPNVGQHTQKPSPLFFQSIASMPLDDFRKTMASLPVNEAL